MYILSYRNALLYRSIEPLREERMSAPVILVNTINNEYGQRDAVEEAATRALAGGMAIGPSR